MDQLFWEYSVKRTGEFKRNSLPKSRISKRFNDKKSAVKYAKEKMDKWLQASLYQNVDNGNFVVVANVSSIWNNNTKTYDIKLKV